MVVTFNTNDEDVDTRESDDLCAALDEFRGLMAFLDDCQTRVSPLTALNERGMVGDNEQDEEKGVIGSNAILVEPSNCEGSEKVEGDVGAKSIEEEEEVDEDSSDEEFEDVEDPLDACDNVNDTMDALENHVERVPERVGDFIVSSDNVETKDVRTAEASFDVGEETGEASDANAIVARKADAVAISESLVDELLELSSSIPDNRLAASREPAEIESKRSEVVQETTETAADSSETVEETNEPAKEISNLAAETSDPVAETSEVGEDLLTL